MKKYLLVTLMISAQSFASGVDCRLSVRHLDHLLGDNQILADEVHRNFAQKNITLIDESDLSEGDYSISNLVKVYKGKVTNPLHRFIFKKNTSFRILPCAAFPLCSPLGMEQEVTNITGVKYEKDYVITKVENGKLKEIKAKTFKHTYRESPTILISEGTYDGSPEQEDLARALVKKIPNCRSLKKMSK